MASLPLYQARPARITNSCFSLICLTSGLKQGDHLLSYLIHNCPCKGNLKQEGRVSASTCDMQKTSLFLQQMTIILFGFLWIESTGYSPKLLTHKLVSSNQENFLPRLLQIFFLHSSPAVLLRLQYI